MPQQMYRGQFRVIDAFGDQLLQKEIEDKLKALS